MEHLLPENGRNVERFLVGSEGTLGVVLGATVRLVADDAERHLVVLGYPSMIEAADAVPALIAASDGRMIACEGLDARIVDLVRAKGNAVPELPPGAGWLFVEVIDPDLGPAGHRGVRRARSPAGGGRSRGGRAVADPGGRRRAGGAVALAAGVLRLGGRRGAPRAAGRLAAGLRRAAEGVRPRRGALRPLRRRLRARADRLRVRGRRASASATSSPSARSSCATTAARSRASTATGGPAPSCCR